MSQPEEAYRSAMVVVAHADDAEFGCSGTVAKWCREGVEVVYVICTNGNKGSDDPEMTSEQLAATREREQGRRGRCWGSRTWSSWGMRTRCSNRRWSSAGTSAGRFGSTGRTW